LHESGALETVAPPEVSRSFIFSATSPVSAALMGVLGFAILLCRRGELFDLGRVFIFLNFEGIESKECMP
jgi:hypothetical protein